MAVVLNWWVAGLFWGRRPWALQICIIIIIIIIINNIK